jgi:hypothetical protein
VISYIKQEKKLFNLTNQCKFIEMSEEVSKLNKIVEQGDKKRLE